MEDSQSLRELFNLIEYIGFFSPWEKQIDEGSFTVTLSHISYTILGEYVTGGLLEALLQCLSVCLCENVVKQKTTLCLGHAGRR